MPWIGGALALGGSALSAFGGGQGDPGPSSVLQNSRKDVLGQSDRWLDSFYGDNWRNSLLGDPGINDQIDGGDGTKRGKFRYGTGAAAGGTAAGSNWGGNTPFGNKPILQQLQAISQASNTGDDAYMNQFNRETGMLANEGNRGYRLAQQFGTGQSKVINTDADRALSTANMLSKATLNSMGLGGSSLVTDSYGANSAGNLRERERALANVADQATGMKIQETNTNLGRKYARSGQAAGLYNTIRERKNQMRMLPVQAQINTLTGSTANPYSVTGGASSGSSGNSLLGNLGTTAGQLGGLYLAQGLFNPGSTGSSGGRAPSPYDVGPLRSNGNYNRGGFVRGPNVDADVVDAKLTPGEYVMSRDEVKQAKRGKVPARVRKRAA